MLYRRVTGPQVVGAVLFPILFFLLALSCVSKNLPEHVWLPRSWVWDHTPITVAWNRAEWSEDQNDAIVRALDAFPCRLFREYDPMYDVVPDVEITVHRDGYHPCSGKHHPLREDLYYGVHIACWPQSGEVVLRSSAPGEWGEYDVYIIVFHELGHAAGLAHDERAKHGSRLISIMAQNIALFLKSAWTIDPTPSLTAADHDALLRRYCDEKEATP